MSPTQIQLYKKGKTIYNKRPKTECDVFDILLSNDSLRMSFLKNFLRNLYTDIEEINMLRFKIETFMLETLGDNHLARSQYGLQHGTFLYVWTHLPVPNKYHHLSIFNKLVPYDIFFVRKGVDDKELRRLQKVCGAPYLMKRNLYESAKLPITDVHSLQCGKCAN